MDEWLDYGFGYGSYIVSPFEEAPPSRSPAPTQAPSYETPPWIDTINRAIERAAQVATLEVAGYPSYPEYPTPSPRPVPLPAQVSVQGAAPRPPGGVTLSTNTLMLLVGGFLLFTLGQRKGR